MGVFNTGIFNAPRYSAFPWTHSNRVSMKSGVIVPIATEYLDTGHKFDGVDVAGIIRNAPMLAPTLDTYRCDIHAFAVRLRSIGHAKHDPWTYEKFYNLNNNQDGSRRLPSSWLGQIFAINGLQKGTLFESLGFPTFKMDREKYLEFIRTKHAYLWDPVVSVVTHQMSDGYSLVAGPSSFPFYGSGNQSASAYNIMFNEVADIVQNFFAASLFVLNNKEFSRKVTFDYSGGSIQFPYIGSLIRFASLRYPAVFQDATLDSSDTSVSPLEVSESLFMGAVLQNGSELRTPFSDTIHGMNVLDKIYEVYKVDSVSVLREYEDYLLDGFLRLRWYDSSVGTDSSVPVWVQTYKAYYSSVEEPTDQHRPYMPDSIFEVLRSSILNTFPDLETRIIVTDENNYVIRDASIPNYWIESYWKIISDWYINTAVDNPDDFFLNYSLMDCLGSSFVASRALDFLYTCNRLFRRLWSNDYFTSAFSSPQAGQAVGIPVNGTIVDLRNANAMQKLKERLLYAGSRFRDVMYAITGKRTSAAILEMSEVIGMSSLTINVDSVLQQSQSNNGAPLADYGGTGLAYRSGSKRMSYKAEEPTVIVIVASIIPQASYFQGFHRKFVRQSVYDYAIPQLANVGEQKVYLGELYVGSDCQETAGYRPEVDGVFGYQRRNADFMWTPSEVHGDFRDSLDFWHNARIFGSRPSLSREFLRVDAEADNLNRIFAVKSDAVDHFYCRFDFGGQIIRSLPKHVHYDL